MVKKINTKPIPKPSVMSKKEEAELRKQIDIMYGDPETAISAYNAEQALDFPDKKVTKVKTTCGKLTDKEWEQKINGWEQF